MSFEGPIEERLAIRELGACYGDAVHRHDTGSFAELWAEDARWQHPELGTLFGRKAIAEIFDRVVQSLPMIHFMAMLGSLRIEADVAAGTSYVSEFVQRNDGSSYRSCGRYDDQYRKCDGTWYFLSRSYTLLHKE
jgi:ketosteroid isomerase-like protein